MLIVYSPQQMLHSPGTFVVAGGARPHPDTPERAESLLRGVAGAAHEILEPPDHGLRYVRLVHTERYLAFLRDAHEQWGQLRNAAEAVVPNVHPRGAIGTYPGSIVGRAGMHIYDLACPIYAATFSAVVWSASSAAEAAMQVASGARKHAYALCRPPGHHSGPDYAGGFCYLNNAAIAVEVLRERFSRIAVLDVDVHHCNGTQDVFYEREDVFVASLHGDPSDFYPFFSGYATETGSEAGVGANHNVPLPRGLGDDEYLVALAGVLERIRAMRADALVVSVGFDGYELDPLSCLKISTDGFRRIAMAITSLGLPTVLVQEGGYLCSDLGRNLSAFLAGFSGQSVSKA